MLLKLNELSQFLLEDKKQLKLGARQNQTWCGLRHHMFLACISYVDKHLAWVSARKPHPNTNNCADGLLNLHNSHISQAPGWWWLNLKRRCLDVESEAVLGQPPNMNLVMGSVLSTAGDNDSGGGREKCLNHLCPVHECQNLPGKSISIF